MAKLSANGTEIARYVRKQEGVADGVLRSTTELSVRSNGRILRKYTAVIHDAYSTKGYRLVSRGWLLWARYPAKQLGAVPGSLHNQYDAAGFVRL